MRPSVWFRARHDELFAIEGHARSPSSGAGLLWTVEAALTPLADDTSQQVSLCLFIAIHSRFRDVLGLALQTAHASRGIPIPILRRHVAV